MLRRLCWSTQPGDLGVYYTCELPPLPRPCRPGRQRGAHEDRRRHRLQVMAPLAEHSENVYSEFGEDGMIRRALEILPDLSKWCVEFGAWDGRFSSNTHRLMDEEG